MRIILLGSGAREHALARAIAADKNCTKLIIAPGNPGTANLGENVKIDILQAREVLALAQKKAVDLVVVGPEAPLVAGVADVLRDNDFNVFGPSRQAAQLEGSKAFAKEIMHQAGVPTARAKICKTLAQVELALDEFGAPYVVKEDGLAAGKGVVVTSDKTVALAHAIQCLGTKKDESRIETQVVVEEYLDGPEVSLFCVCDGKKVVALQPAQDFKRIKDDDIGPNTGGMGAYSPLPWAPANLAEEVVQKVAQPVVDEMAKRGTPFQGLLYCGLALTTKGLRVVEFNVRFGDPETQVVLARLDSSVVKLFMASAQGNLHTLPPLRWSSNAAVTVVLAANGYPQTPQIGAVIEGLGCDDFNKQQYVLHAGTQFGADNEILVSGGRVLSVVGCGVNLATAQKLAYEKVADISFTGLHYRRDIAKKAVENTIKYAADRYC